MYLEIEKYGSIYEALNKEFLSINSPLRVEVDEILLKPSMSLAIIKKNNKYSQVYLSKEEELYLPDFWRNGVCLAIGQTSNIKELVSVINYWLLECLILKKHSPFYFTAYSNRLSCKQKLDSSVSFL